jgi:3-oxoacyl-[acyl-carrier-protein] synthase II
LGGERRVVVTGLGVISSIGLDVESYWNALLAGRSGVRRLVGFDSKDFACKIAGGSSHFSQRNRPAAE